MSALKKSNSKAAGLGGPNSEIDQIMGTLGAQLRDWTNYTELVNSTLKDVNQLQADLDVDNKPINLVKGRLFSAYDQMTERSERELTKLEFALESLDKIIKLTPPDNQQDGTGKRGPYKKKTKGLDGQPAQSTPGSPHTSALGSPAPDRLNLHPSPLTALAPLPQQSSQPTPRSTSVKPIAPLPNMASRAGSPAAPPSSSGASATSALPPKKWNAKSRKDWVNGQLPLGKGRAVAFRLPAKAGAGDVKSENWILARVISSINGDKNRYHVEDVDYNPQEPTPEQGRYNATLKSLVPLPDSRTAETRAATYPPQEFPPGTQVMALYPDTTSFYKAWVVSGPESVASLGEKGKKRERVYKVKFDDDDDVVRAISIDFVVEP